MILKFKFKELLISLGIFTIHIMYTKLGSLKIPDPLGECQQKLNGAFPAVPQLLAGIQLWK